MPPEINISRHFKEGRQQDGTFIVQNLSPYHSSETLIEHRKEGFSYYFFNRSEVTHWIDGLLPYVNFDKKQKKLLGKQVEEGIKMLLNNPRGENKKDQIDVRLDFSPEEAQFFLNDNIVRFMNQEALNDTFLKVLPQGTIEGWGISSSWCEEFIKKIKKTVVAPPVKFFLQS